MNKRTIAMLERLGALGISVDDRLALRRIEMTLHRWFERECGDSNNYGSWAIVRGRKEGGEFTHDDDGAPYVEHHIYNHGKGKDTVRYTRIPDRETGARKRLAAIMSRYNTLLAYIQTDPRGCALYIVRLSDIPEGGEISGYYTRGVAVCD